MALGNEIIVNWEFTSDTWWIKGTGATIDNNLGHCNTVASTSNQFTSPLLTGIIVDGTEYNVLIEILNTSSGSIFVDIGGTRTTLTGDNIYEFRVVAGADERVRIRSGDTGAVLDVDYISVKEVLSTTVEIEWIDSLSAAATGNKIYRDDVEIADVANGIQFYSDDTAETGTTYKYEVQAHDGAGDETTQEVEGENMDYITTAS